jgi:choline dehydrogenase
MTGHDQMTLPATIDILICGGGTSGAALAGILVRDTDATVVLLEAGPDYGPLHGGRWPADLLDARRIPESHGWGYAGSAHNAHVAETPFERAKVIGGCSSHNGCIALLGHRRDYDAWAELGNDGWGWDSVAPAFDRALRALRVAAPPDDDVTPFHRSFIDGAVQFGIPLSPDMNDPDETAGVGASPVNVVDGTRWNTALAYLDPVRDTGRLTIIGDALVDRIEVSAGRAVAAHVIIDGTPQRITAGRIVLAAGAYGSPSILLRSGIGPAADLATLGISSVLDLPGVGRSLADHPAINLRYRASELLDREMDQFASGHWSPDEQSLAKARSSICREAFDIHIYAVAGWRTEDGDYVYGVAVSSVFPRSTGTITLRSADPSVPPRINHNYLSDPDGEDLRVLLDGFEMTRAIMAPSIERGLLAEEIKPGSSLNSHQDIESFIEQTVGIYYHPACSCRMGPSTDPTAVVNADGKLHGVDNFYVCDASIFPTLMRANTNLPAAMLAEHVAPKIAR